MPSSLLSVRIRSKALPHQANRTDSLILSKTLRNLSSIFIIKFPLKHESQGPVVQGLDGQMPKGFVNPATGIAFSSFAAKWCDWLLKPPGAGMETVDTGWSIGGRSTNYLRSSGYHFCSKINWTPPTTLLFPWQYFEKYDVSIFHWLST